MRDIPSRPPAAPSTGVLIAISTLQPIGINMFIPSLPAMQRDFAVDTTTIQLTISLYLLATATIMLLLGPMSDRYGRRPVLLAGLAFFVAGSLLSAIAQSIGLLLLGRVLQAGGASAGIALARAIVRDVYDRERSASMIGYVTMGMAVAPMVTPAIGGLLDEGFGWRASFVAMTGIGAVVLAYAAVAMPETNLRRSAGGGLGALASGFRQLWRERAFRLYAGLAAVSSAVFFAFVGGAPHVAVAMMKLAPSVYGFYFAFVAAGYIVGNFLTGRYAARIGMRRMIVVGCVINLAGVVCAAAPIALGLLHPVAFFAPMLLVGIGSGLVLPSAIAGAVSVRPDLAGAASGITGSVQVGLGAVATTAVGAVTDAGILGDGAWAMLTPMLVFAAIALGFAARAPR